MNTPEPDDDDTVIPELLALLALILVAYVFYRLE
jgi:hypothetical protein